MYFVGEDNSTIYKSFLLLMFFICVYVLMMFFVFLLLMLVCWRSFFNRWKFVDENKYEKNFSKKKQQKQYMIQTMMYINPVMFLWPLCVADMFCVCFWL